MAVSFLPECMFFIEYDFENELPSNLIFKKYTIHKKTPLVTILTE